MKKIIIAVLLLPCFATAQVKTAISFTLPTGFTSGISFCTSESDVPVSQSQAGAGQHTINIETNGPATGFLYLAATKKFIPFKLNGKPTDLTNRLAIPTLGDEDLEGAAVDVLPAVLQRFVNVTSSLKYLGYVPDVINDSNAAKEKVRQYYRGLQGMVAFADSVVTAYPANNASLFTVFRLAHWCSYSPEVYTILNKLDPVLLKSDFAKELITRKQELVNDSLIVAGKKPGLGLQMVANNPTLIAAGARKKLMIYWDDNTRLDIDLIEDIKRLHLLFSNKELQVNFVYTGSNKNWQPLIKQPGMPSFANYVHCNKADQLGNSPVLAANDNTGLSAGARGYYLYHKLNVE